MKTLILYDDKGTIFMTQEVENDSNYGCLIEDIPEGKQPIRVDTDNKCCILDDTEEVKAELAELQKKIEEREEEATDKETELLNLQASVAELQYQQFLLSNK